MGSWFEFPLVLIPLAIVIAVVVWVLSLLGILDGGSEASLGDAGGADGSVGAAGSEQSLARMLGMGMVPGSILLTLILFLFGWIGIGIAAMVPDFAPWIRFAIAAPLALLMSVILSALLARPLAPWFRDYGSAARGSDLVGRIALLTSSEFSQLFGTARIKLEDGTLIEISVRPESDIDSGTPKLGDKLVITRYETSSNLYFATRLDE